MEMRDLGCCKLKRSSPSSSSRLFICSCYLWWVLMRKSGAGQNLTVLGGGKFYQEQSAIAEHRLQRSPQVLIDYDRRRTQMQRYLRRKETRPQLLWLA